MATLSCSKKSKNPTGPYNTTPPVETEKVQSSVTTTEIGGQSLTVKSVYQEEAAVKGGTYSTTVSDEGSQLLFVTDSANQVRGLTFSTLEGNTPTILPCDARSTALSLILLTPGITTVSPEETAQRVSDIEKLTSFSSLVSELKLTLQQKTVQEAVATEKMQSLLEACIVEYFNAVSSSAPKISAILEDRSYFAVNKTSGSNPTVELKNPKPRNVNVGRKDFLDGGQTNTVLVAESMDGSRAMSWGSVISGTAYDPTIKNDSTYHLTSSLRSSEYWIYGPGWASTAVPLPNDLKAVIYTGKQWTIWTNTLWNYLALPILTFCCGSSDLAPEASTSVKEALSVLDISMSFNELQGIEPNTWKDIATPIINISIAIFGAVAAASSAPAWVTVAAGFFAAGSVGFSSVNIIALGSTLIEVPSTSVFTIAGTAPSYYAVSGRVLESSTGLSGVSVRLVGADKDTTATTGSDGTYTFTGLPGITYEITPTLEGYTFDPENRILTIVEDTTIDDFIATKNGDGGGSGGGDPNDVTLIVQTPQGTQSGDVTITYTLQAPAGTSHQFSISYGHQGIGQAHSSTIKSTSTGTRSGSRLSDITPGTHTFIWDSSSDLPNVNNNTVQVTMSYIESNGNMPWAEQTEFFSVNNTENRTPDSPRAVTDRYEAEAGVALTCEFMSFDDDYDNVAFIINWGDGIISGWSALMAHNEYHSFQYTYYQSGTYLIKIKVKDSHGNETAWCDVVNVTVTGGGGGGGNGGGSHDIADITFVTIPGGTFEMGDVEGGGDSNETVHTVTLYEVEMSVYEITNSQYAAYLNEALESGDIEVTSGDVYGKTGDWSGQRYLDIGYSWNSSNQCRIQYGSGVFTVTSSYENWPVVAVTWYGSKAFALYYGFDLPTESEWEYACRGGRQYKYGTDDGTISSSKANYNSNVGHPVDVGSYPGNPFGLYDMSGNVWEWCHDWYGTYPSGSVTNPTGGKNGSYRVSRGGGWSYGDDSCRAAYRGGVNPVSGPSLLGFRVVRRVSLQNY